MKKWNSKTWKNRKSKNADSILIDRPASSDACEFLSVDGHGDMADDMDIQSVTHRVCSSTFHLSLYNEALFTQYIRTLCTFEMITWKTIMKLVRIEKQMVNQWTLTNLSLI